MSKEVPQGLLRLGFTFGDDFYFSLNLDDICEDTRASVGVLPEEFLYFSDNLPAVS